MRCFATRVLLKPLTNQTNNFAKKGVNNTPFFIEDLRKATLENNFIEIA